MLHPRTSLGEVFGRVIVNRLLVRLRFDERRVAEILKGLDRASLGDDFVPTTGRILSHLGDIASLGLTPLPPAAIVGGTRETPPGGGTAQYLLHLESSDIALLRAEVESLGFQSAVSPGGLARLAHAGIRAAMLSFREGVEPAQLAAVEAKWRRIYGAVIKEGFDLSLCWAVEGRVENGDFLVLFGGSMDPAVPRETSPLIATNDLGLVALGKAMRGDSPDD
ncbi:hypothetical protein H632_c2802p1 [Helicosporidium sp. ATCC 50920]|nr:hypothetical protein H632_c2802p1 [Helicosporidium sp. ATCC 50920]|eukprot:KDD72862.1 hypothetical protein H632_c2802p1 [Helicosporidium sp. ATCC 50920]